LYAPAVPFVNRALSLHHSAVAGAARPGFDRVVMGARPGGVSTAAAPALAPAKPPSRARGGAQSGATMASIPVQISREIAVGTSPHRMHELVSNVPRSVSHWPDVQNLVHVDGTDYRWEMVPVSYAGMTMQPVYVLRYGWDREALRVWWDPVPQEGHFVQATGYWQLAAGGAGTAARFELDMRFELPVPTMLAGMARQLLEAEVGKQVDTYLAAITRTLESAA
jgi:hypothetical protein